jgi:ribosomal protein L21E
LLGLVDRYDRREDYGLFEGEAVSQRHVVGGHNAGYFSHVGDIVHPKIDPTAHWTLMEVFSAVSWCRTRCLALELHGVCYEARTRGQTSSNAGYFSHVGDIVHPKIDPTAHWTIGL